MGQQYSKSRKPQPAEPPQPPTPPPQPPTPPPQPAASPRRRLSRSAVDGIVDDFMRDEAINSALLPDFIERSIYRNIIHLMLGIIGRVLDTTEFSFLGHNVTMKLTPEEPEPEALPPV